MVLFCKSKGAVMSAIGAWAWDGRADRSAMLLRFRAWFPVALVVLEHRSGAMANGNGVPLSR